MHKKLTITIDQRVYDALHRIVGRGSISQFIEALVRPQVLDSELEDGYRQMARDEAREHEAHQWAEATIGDACDATR
jgi:predicted CopG family antitoxin